MKQEKAWIKNWPEQDQPREKLAKSGAGSLTDSELLAILLRTGRRESNAIELARELLESAGNDLHELGQRPLGDLQKIKGIGLSKAMTIAAALEIGRRRQSQSFQKKIVVGDSREAAGYLRPLLADYGQEVFGILYLKPSGRVKHFEIISKGGVSSTVVDPRVVFKKAMDMEAASLIICHNHPSGSLRPSKADLALTAKLDAGAKILDIKLVDHIIVGDSGYFSFADEGLL